MEAAEQDEVVEARLAAVGPVLDVMCVGPLGRAVAAGEAAAAVAQDQGAADGGRDGAYRATDIERLAAAADGDAGDGGIAGEATDQVGDDRARPAQLTRGRAGLALQGGEWAR